ncbi:MAG: Na/Pi cotransporter family protein [Planctomycetaceae bacterium]|nr:Na/Pi cotransporter family protein [Planctomycetaceae bacterium]MBT6483578.1 Na/Pi cotransporter family protein [Planctomycetaceae bacterium]MBT6495347.1 Na/Pi cotransporter family protein [Planctomycetaceae bacterium]
MIAVAIGRGGIASGESDANTDTNAVQTAVAADDTPNRSGEESTGRRIVKWIPDQKAYSGSPQTRISLQSLFETENGESPILTVSHNTKEKYVAASIEGNELVLDWKKVGKAEIIIDATDKAGAVISSKFTATVWEANYWTLTWTVIGGLGIFLFGMKSMSDGLQAVAGDGLRRMIAFVTDNRFLAIGAGAFATTVVQSSSITTVMVVGFVNSGFMQLSQAIGVIMGANIGTTITGWVIALKIGKYGLPIAGICIFGYLFSRSDRIRFISMFGMGLGLVFLGLEVMKDGFVMVKSLPEFEAYFASFSADTYADTYAGVLKCAAVGCVLTFIVQSSSATLGITITLAQIGVIPFETAAALVLGENIGTTITALLASLGATTNAKRAAYFHVIFNLIGVAVITALFQLYIPCVKQFVTWMGGVDPATGNVEVTKAIAATHTGFNVINTLVFLPLVGLMARFLQWSVREKAHKETPHLTSLDLRVLETPAIAIEQSRVELLRMAEGCSKMMGWLKELIGQDEPDPQLRKKLFHREEVLDNVQDEIASFMTNLLSGNVPHTIVAEGRRQLRMADEYESISDYITSILKFHLKLRNQGHKLDARHLQDVMRLHEMVSAYLELVNSGMRDRQPEVITKANSMGAEVTHLVKKLRDEHLEALSEERMPPYINLAYTSTLNSYRRVRDHAKNIAEALAGEK